MSSIFSPYITQSKTLTDVQEIYTSIEKELLAVVFTFEKFRPYRILSRVIVFTDHSALCYMFSKIDAKPILIRWVLVLWEIDVEIKDKRGAENLSVDYLSKLEHPSLDKMWEREINDAFLEKHLHCYPNYSIPETI